MTKKLTEPQKRALAALAKVRETPVNGCDYLSPAALGAAVNTRVPPLKAQGYGRQGGTMGTRLVRFKLAEHRYIESSAWGLYDAGYRITAKGVRALEAGEREV